MFSAKNMPEDHAVALKIVTRDNPKLAPQLLELYQQAQFMMNGAQSDNPAFIRKKVTQNGDTTAIVINASTGLFVQLAVRQNESSSTQLSVGRFSLMTVADPNSHALNIKLWN